ncbi:YicC family protein [bacterium]|nr:YicC family protein [bacterium]
MTKSPKEPIHSMTGFGSARSLLPQGEILVEVKSVNGKNLEARLSLPRGLFSLEPDIRKLIREKLTRGNLQLQITVPEAGEGAASFSEDSLKKLSEKLKEQCALLGFRPEGNIDTLLRLLQLEKEEERTILDGDAEKVLLCVGEALDKLVESRSEEGEKLRKDLIARLPALDNIVARIRELAPGVVSDYRERLFKQLKELSQTSGVAFDPVRVLTEVGIFSEKADIEEELTRLSCHFELYKNTLKEGGVIGRRLDFITQEAFREITTCGNKASSAEISALVVKMKEELEKMREQAQNIE